ncbi:MAG: hypothetical protein RMY29_016035 [Nostoc sp. CreGUA01]|nr:hypothetical protein [Nostoc sp. CreGUA01]
MKPENQKQTRLQPKLSEPTVRVMPGIQLDLSEEELTNGGVGVGGVNASQYGGGDGGVSPSIPTCSGV